MSRGFATARSWTSGSSANSTERHDESALTCGTILTKLIDAIVARAPDIAALRRDLHAHPELSFAEIRTSGVVAQKLMEWGVPIHRGMGATGVVGILKNGSSGRAIGLRADMDALPIREANNFEH